MTESSDPSASTTASAEEWSEEQLRRWVHRWRSMAESSHEFLTILDRNYRYLYVNRVAPGLTLEQLIGKATPFDFLEEPFHTPMRQAIDAAFRGETSQLETHVSYLGRWWSNVVSPLVQDGGIEAVSLVCRDITEQKTAMEALRERERHLMLALSAGDLATFECDVASDQWVFSARAYELWGYEQGSPDMPNNLPKFLARLHPDDLPSLRDQILASIHGDAPVDVEYRILHASGEYRWIQARARGYTEEDGKTRLFGIIGDITQRKLAEAEHVRLDAQLRHAQKMETLGTLAGGIAHDFNNILLPILGNAELVERQLPRDSHVRPLLDDIVRAATRAQELVSRILLFGRFNEDKREAVYVQDVAREALRLVSASLPPTIRVQLQVEENLPPVWGWSGQIHQAITNLATNAYQALRDRGGRLVLSVARVGQDGRSRLSPTLRERSLVVVSVEDDGPGIPYQLQERVFEPFFTTKRVGEGTGLGLSIVHSIMARHEGAVLVHSVPSQGARFELFFPCSTAAEQQTPVSAPPAEQGQLAGARILCVDDELAVLNTLNAMLSYLGCRPTCLGSPSEALANLEAGANYDVVMSDYSMPGLTGIQLAERCLQLAPALPVLLMSGYAELPEREKRPRNIVGVLRKPMSMKAVMAALSGALKRDAPARLDAR